MAGNPDDEVLDSVSEPHIICPLSAISGRFEMSANDKNGAGYDVRKRAEKHA